MNQNTKKLLRIEQIALDMYRKVNESSYIQDVSSEISELLSELDLDIRFSENEVKQLKSLGYKVNKSSTEATFRYKNVPIKVTKSDFDFFSVEKLNTKKGNTIDATLSDLKSKSSMNYIIKELTNDTRR